MSETALHFGSVCSGIEAASVAWHPMGWQAGFVSEIDRHASAVLRHHFGPSSARPGVPNHGDFTTITASHDGTALDLLVGGTPCQDFSVAGLRAGLAGDRGNLTLEFLRLADRLSPEWVVWENVPGVLSIDGGRAFGAFLGGLAELGYGFAYRVLDAQFAGVPQRRRRVFVVGHLGDWRRAAAVLLERESLSGHPPPRREAGAGLAGALTASSGQRRLAGVEEAAAGHLLPHVVSGGATNPYGDHESREGLLVCATGDVTHTLRAEGCDASEDGTGRGTPVVAYQCHGSNVGEMGTLRAGNGNETGGVPFVMATGQAGAEVAADGSPSLTCDHEAPIVFNWQSGGDCRINPSASGTDALHIGQVPAIGFTVKGWGHDAADEVSPTLCNQHSSAGVARAMQVRRLTPRECERLQGFPDDWTRWGDYGDGRGTVEISDTQRYKMCGNSMAVPVMRWIGERIALIHGMR